MGRPSLTPLQGHEGLAGHPAELALGGATAAYAHDLNPVELVWGNVKAVELANLCPDTIDEAQQFAEVRIPVILDTRSGPTRTVFRAKADAVPAQSGQARGQATPAVVCGCQVAQPNQPGHLTD